MCISFFAEEIEYLQKKNSEAEQRNEELTSSLGNATRPVLRQLESLQASYNTHSHNWDQAERQLTERLGKMPASCFLLLRHHCFLSACS